MGNQLSKLVIDPPMDFSSIGGTLIQLMTAVDASMYVGPGAVARNELRRRQIASNLAAFYRDHKELLQKQRMRLVWVDNTVAGRMPPAVDAALPPTVERFHFLRNNYGCRNKGAGLIESWREIDCLLGQYTWLVYIEGRCRILSTRFLEQFFERPRGLFRDPRTNPYRNDGGWLQTSMFAARASQIRQMAEEIDLVALGRVSIERCIGRWCEHEFAHELDLEWHDAAQDRLIRF